jgi:hypothetical protein
MKSESHDLTASEILATAPVPPDQLAAIKKRDPVLHDLILAHQLGLRPPPRLNGPLWPELRRVSNVLSFLLAVFEHCGCDGDLTVQEVADGLVEVLRHFESELEDLVTVARQRDELHGYSAPENGGVQ